MLSHPSYTILNIMNHWSKTIEFSTLLTSTARYKTQNKIDESRFKLYVACFFYYKLHLPTVIHYLGVTIPELIETSNPSELPFVKTIAHTISSTPSPVSLGLDAHTFLSLTPLIITSSSIKSTEITKVSRVIQIKLNKQ